MIVRQLPDFVIAFLTPACLGLQIHRADGEGEFRRRLSSQLDHAQVLQDSDLFRRHSVDNLNTERLLARTLMRTTILLSLTLTTAAAAVSDDSTIAELRTAFEDRTGQEQIAAASKLLAADPESAQKVVWFFNGVYVNRRAGAFGFASAIKPGMVNAVDLLLKQLVKGDRSHKMLAMTALAEHPELTREPLVALLKSADADSRHWAVLTLNRANPTDLESEYLPLLDDPSPEVRLETALRLSWNEEHTAKVGPVLQGLMESEGVYVRARIIRDLRFRDPSPPEFVSIFNNALNDADEGVRFSSAQFLAGKDLVESETLLKPLSEGLRRKTRSRRGAAATILSRLGTDASPVLDELTRMMEEDEELSVRADCVMAICTIDPDRYLEHLPRMLRMIKQPDGYVDRRMRLVDFVGQRGTLSTPAVVPFEILLRNKKDRLRVALAVALMRIDSTRSQRAVAAVKEWANGNFRLSVHSSSFKGLGDAGRPLEPILTQVANDPEHLLQRRAQMLLRYMHEK